MTFVRTILGDISTEELGFTYSHDHIVIDESYVTDQNPEFLLNDEVKIVRELKEFYQLGGRTMVDTMPANCGRNALKLASVSDKSGVNLLAPTGLHLEQYYPVHHWRYQLTEDQLSELFIADILDGIDRFDYNGPTVERTNHRAGLIKLATGDQKFTSHQQMIFRAVVNAHLETGAPILTHTNYGHQAFEQARLLISLGADPEHIVLSHLDRKVDVNYHRKVLDTGVRIEYDSAFRWKNQPNGTYLLLRSLLTDYHHQIVMGMDAARNRYWKSYGGLPGLSFLLVNIKQELEGIGMEQYYENIFYEVPKKLFSFKPNSKSN